MKVKVLHILKRVPLLTPIATVGLAPRVANLVSQMLPVSLVLRVASDGMVKMTIGNVKVRCPKIQILP